jgi:hypothetical protein
MKRQAPLWAAAAAIRNKHFDLFSFLGGPAPLLLHFSLDKDFEQPYI